MLLLYTELMIRQIRGTVAGLEHALVIVEAGGIGYGIHVSEPTSQFAVGSEAVFHTHLAVRETSHDLYGFTNRDLLEVFELLITLPKIGPKSALQILHQADIALLKQAVRNDDPTYLSKMSGIGKKSAEKIVAGLKEKLDDVADEAFVTGSADTEPATTYAHDTIDALVSLGYSPDESRRVVRRLAETQPEISTSPEALKAALKQLSS